MGRSPTWRFFSPPTLTGSTGQRSAPSPAAIRRSHCRQSIHPIRHSLRSLSTTTKIRTGSPAILHYVEDMIESRSASLAAHPYRDFDALAAAVRRAVRGRHAQDEALIDYITTLRVATLVADDAGCYIGANETACRLTGYTHNE